MTPRFARLILVSVASLGLLLTLVWPGEPTYHQKTLSEWLALLPKNVYPLTQAEEVQHTERAIREIGPKAVPYLMKWLRYERPGWRNTLLAAAQKLPAGSPSSKAVVHWIEGKGEVRRANAIDGLRLLGPQASEAVPALTAMVIHWRTNPQWTNAMYLLGCIGEKGLPPLITALTNRANPAAVRCVAAQSIPWTFRNLQDGSPAIPALFDCLHEQNERLVLSAAMALGGASAQEAILRCVRSTDTAVALDALDWLRSSSHWIAAKLAVPTLIQALDHANPLVASKSAGVLAKLEGESDITVPALIKKVRDSRPIVQYAAARALGQLGEAANPAVPVLVEAAQADDAYLRQEATNSLANIPAYRVPQLIEILRDPDPSVRRDAAWKLGGLGLAADAAVPALLHCLQDSDQSVRLQATNALLQIPAFAVPILIEQLAATDRASRARAASGLSYFGRHARPAVPALVRSLEDRDSKVAAYAALSLGQLALEPDIVVPALTNLLSSTNLGLRNCAALALGGFAEKATSAIPHLQLLLEDPAEKVRRTTTNSIQQIVSARLNLVY